MKGIMRPMTTQLPPVVVFSNPGTFLFEQRNLYLSHGYRAYDLYVLGGGGGGGGGNGSNVSVGSTPGGAQVLSGNWFGNGGGGGGAGGLRKVLNLPLQSMQAVPEVIVGAGGPGGAGGVNPGTGVVSTGVRGTPGGNSAFEGANLGYGGGAGGGARNGTSSTGAGGAGGSHVAKGADAAYPPNATTGAPITVGANGGGRGGGNGAYPAAGISVEGGLGFGGGGGGFGGEGFENPAAYGSNGGGSFYNDGRVGLAPVDILDSAFWNNGKIYSGGGAGGGTAANLRAMIDSPLVPGAIEASLLGAGGNGGAGRHGTLTGQNSGGKAGNVGGNGYSGAVVLVFR